MVGQEKIPIRYTKNINTKIKNDFKVISNLRSYLFLPFFNRVVFLDVCDVGGLPPEGVAEVGLAAAGLAVVVGALGAAGLPAAPLPFVGGRTKAAAD